MVGALHGKYQIKNLYSLALNGRDFRLLMLKPFFWDTCIGCIFGGIPFWNPLILAESLKKCVFGNLDLMITSANGERHIFPKQNIRIFFTILNYNESFLVKSSTYFLNCLSVEDRLSTVLQAWSTVAWSRFPIWDPMLAKEAFVNFLAKNIASCLAWTICRFLVFDCNVSTSIWK